MVRRERDAQVSGLFWDRWEEQGGGGGGFINMLTGDGCAAAQPPIEARGGLLADDMG